MASSWALALTGSLLFAASTSRSVKIMGAIGVIVVLLFIIYLMIRSLGFNSKTPFSMVVRKFTAFAKSWITPFFLPKQLEKVEELHNSGKLEQALELYLSLFDFDGLTSNRAHVAIHNDTILQGIEEICEQTSYEFPAERINRFREDLYDYFLVKTKYLASHDYDGTPLHRAENEERFKSDLNLSQEHQLIEGFEHFLTTLVNKIEQHIKHGAQILPRGTRTSHTRSGSFSQGELHAGQAAGDPFQRNATPFAGSPVGQAELTPPPDIFGGHADPFGDEPSSGENTPPDPFASAPPVGDVAPPPGLFGDNNDAGPFSYNDPLDPYQDATGVLHKLPGATEDPPQRDPFAGMARGVDTGDDSTRVTSVPASPPPPPVMGGMHMPQATGGFPGFATPNAGVAPPPAPSGFPQPTGAFPGFGQAPMAPQPTGAFPGMGAPAPSGFPQPTGAFPGFGQAPMAPQPTGAFPGTAPAPSGFPQPTGAFPGMGAPAPSGFPQPTGAFPGFGQAPMAPPGGGVPQATGGFPGFQQPPQPLPPNPFGFPNDKKK